jgi:hypothetical protein
VDRAETDGSFGLHWRVSQVVWIVEVFWRLISYDNNESKQFAGGARDQRWSSIR